MARNVSIYPENCPGMARDNRYRFQWTAPILVSQHDPKVVYHAANVLFRTKTVDRPGSDQPGPDAQRQGQAEMVGGPITGDNTGVSGTARSSRSPSRRVRRLHLDGER